MIIIIIIHLHHYHHHYHYHHQQHLRNYKNLFRFFLYLGKCHTDKHKIEFPEIPEYFREVLKQYRPKVSNRTPSQVLKSFDKGLDDDDDYDVNLVSLDQTTM